MYNAEVQAKMDIIRPIITEAYQLWKKDPKKYSIRFLEQKLESILLEQHIVVNYLLDSPFRLSFEFYSKKYGLRAYHIGVGGNRIESGIGNSPFENSFTTSITSSSNEEDSNSKNPNDDRSNSLNPNNHANQLNPNNSAYQGK